MIATSFGYYKHTHVQKISLESSSITPLFPSEVTGFCVLMKHTKQANILKYKGKYNFHIEKNFENTSLTDKLL